MTITVEIEWHSDDHITIPKDIKEKLYLYAVSKLSEGNTKDTLTVTIDGREYYGKYIVDGKTH